MPCSGLHSQPVVVLRFGKLCEACFRNSPLCPDPVSRGPFLFQGQLDWRGTIQDGEAVFRLPPQLPRQLQ